MIVLSVGVGQRWGPTDIRAALVCLPLIMAACFSERHIGPPLPATFVCRYQSFEAEVAPDQPELSSAVH